jgi:polysaccharide export outer membrane protein
MGMPYVDQTRILLLSLWLSVCLTGCGAWETMPEETPQIKKDIFEVPDRSQRISSFDALQAFKEETTQTDDYLLFDGDDITIEVVGRQELSGKHRIGPDGRITLPVAGPVILRNLTRTQAADKIYRALSPYYLNIYVTVGVDQYTSNRVIVIGRVENPGEIQFDTPPTLLEILAKAGGLPLLRKEQVLTRCAVIRKEKILWVDLTRLLTGDIALNVPLQRNDVVYIPDATDTSVFVLGSVHQPGVYRLTPQMSFMDALAQAGGVNKDGNTHELHLIRPHDGVNKKIALEDLLSPDPNLNLAMQEGDIIYVPRSGISKVGYYLQQINPFALLLMIVALM